MLGKKLSRIGNFGRTLLYERKNEFHNPSLIQDVIDFRQVAWYLLDFKKAEVCLVTEGSEIDNDG
jgi:flavin-dependent dehydrogenase